MGRRLHSSSERCRAFSSESKGSNGSILGVRLLRLVRKASIGSVSRSSECGCARLLPMSARGLYCRGALRVSSSPGGRLAIQDQGIKRWLVRLRFPAPGYSGRQTAPQGIHCLGGDCVHRFASPASELLHEVLNQQRNIIWTFAQWRKEYGHHNSNDLGPAALFQPRCTIPQKQEGPGFSKR